MADINSPLLEMCVKCNLHFLPPIYQCPKKHILCNNCTQEAEYMQSVPSYSLRSEKKLNLKSVTKVKLYCGICSCFYFNDKGRRNKKLENLAQSIQHPCIYHDNGCQFKNSYPDIENHIAICDYIIKKCCWENCLWEGTLLNMKNHLKLDHSVLKANEVESLRNDSTFSFFFDDDFFLIKILLLEDSIKFCVLYCGTPDKYVFEIQVGTKTKVYVKINHVIKQMKHNKSLLFDFENSEIFTVDIDFLTQFIKKLRESCVPDEVFFRVDVLKIEELIEQNRVNTPIPVEKKVKNEEE